MEQDRYAYGRPEDMSQEVRTVFYHEDDEPYDPFLHINSFKDFYYRSMISFSVLNEKWTRKITNHYMEQEKIKKVRKSLVTSGFFKNPVISFSVLRAKKTTKSSDLVVFLYQILGI